MVTATNVTFLTVALKWRRPDLRNHRKIVVVDGRVGFIGSLNMIDASYHNRKRWCLGGSAISTT